MIQHAVLFFLMGLSITVLVLLYVTLPNNDNTKQQQQSFSAYHQSYNKKNNKETDLLIVISFDGFRNDYLSKKLTPNMIKLAEEGVTGHMLSTFSTKTFPNHQSISTGLYQETHGIVHNLMYDPVFDEHFVDKEDGRADRWWDNKIATPIYIANQLQGPERASCCAPWVGCHVHYYGKYRARYHRHYNKSADWEEQMEWALHRATSHSYHSANLVMVYFPEPDFTGHRDGPFGRATIEQVRRIDNIVGYLLGRLRELLMINNTNLILLSDHGLSEISPSRVTVLDLLLNSTWYDAYGGNPVIHVQPRVGHEKIVESALRSQQAMGHYRLYSKHKMPARYRYRHHRRIHQYVLIADEGWSLHKNQLEAEKEMDCKGQHGYDNLLPEMRPLFLGIGPAFKRHYRHQVPFTNVDLYPLMLQLLDIKPDTYYHEGNLSLVQDMLLVK